ncbi:MAG TPA: hypothetical protein VN698_10360, partial [Bacteroidia bacterium]|nr:hypothetical protein [Bacteroidia bacterium]
NLNVNMHEEQNFVYPKLTLSSNPLTHTFYWSASLAYYIPTKRKEYVSFTQTGNGSQGSYSVGDVNFASSNITLLNDGKPISKVPFNMSGFAFMFTIGVNIHIR